MKTFLVKNYLKKYIYSYNFQSLRKKEFFFITNFKNFSSNEKRIHLPDIFFCQIPLFFRKHILVWSRRSFFLSIFENKKFMYTNLRQFRKLKKRNFLLFLKINRLGFLCFSSFYLFFVFSTNFFLLKIRFFFSSNFLYFYSKRIKFGKLL